MRPRDQFEQIRDDKHKPENERFDALLEIYLDNCFSNSPEVQWMRYELISLFRVIVGMTKEAEHPDLSATILLNKVYEFFKKDSMSKSENKALLEDLKKCFACEFFYYRMGRGIQAKRDNVEATLANEFNKDNLTEEKISIVRDGRLLSVMDRQWYPDESAEEPRNDLLKILNLATQVEKLNCSNSIGFFVKRIEDFGPGLYLDSCSFPEFCEKRKIPLITQEEEEFSEDEVAAPRPGFFRRNAFAIAAVLLTIFVILLIAFIPPVGAVVSAYLGFELIGAEGVGTLAAIILGAGIVGKFVDWLRGRRATSTEETDEISLLARSSHAQMKNVGGTSGTVSPDTITEKTMPLLEDIPEDEHPDNIATHNKSQHRSFPPRSAGEG